MLLDASLVVKSSPPQNSFRRLNTLVKKLGNGIKDATFNKFENGIKDATVTTKIAESAEDAEENVPI